MDDLRDLDAELGEKLTELIDAIQASGKKGSLTLKLDIAPMEKTSVESVKVATEIKLTKPLQDRRPTIFFIDDDLHLTRRDPRQHDIEDSIHSLPGGRQD